MEKRTRSEQFRFVLQKTENRWKSCLGTFSEFSPLFLQFSAAAAAPMSYGVVVVGGGVGAGYFCRAMARLFFATQATQNV